jgi:uncharacterized protein YjbI with pentapeptide repeats
VREILKTVIFEAFVLRVVIFRIRTCGVLILKGSHLYGTVFYGANCADCNFSGALLQGVVFYGASLEGANFSGARLLADNMGVPCSLSSADLQNANLERAILKDCEYSSTTLFPTGFNPEAHGMVREH